MSSFYYNCIVILNKQQLTPTWYNTFIAVCSCNFFLWKLPPFKWFLWLWWWCSVGYLWKTSKGILVLTQKLTSTKTVMLSIYMVISFFTANIQKQKVFLGSAPLTNLWMNELRKILHSFSKCYFDHFTKRTTMLHPRHEWNQIRPPRSTYWR